MHFPSGDEKPYANFQWSKWTIDTYPSQHGNSLTELITEFVNMVIKGEFKFSGICWQLLAIHSFLSPFIGSEHCFRLCFIENHFVVIWPFLRSIQIWLETITGSLRCYSVISGIANCSIISIYEYKKQYRARDTTLWYTQLCLLYWNEIHQRLHIDYDLLCNQ